VNVATILASALALASFVGQLTPTVSTDGSYVLGAGDRIRIHCLNADEFSAEPLREPLRIDNDGQVTLPFMGRVRIAGLTVSTAEKQLTEQLSKYIRHAQIEINLVETRSQPVSVFGAVRNPGTYQLEGRRTLSEVLSMAGGLRPEAGQTLKLTRQQEWGPISVPAGKQAVTTGDVSVVEINLDELIRGHAAFLDLEVRPHDIISIPQADLVFVVGQVRKPGGFPMSDSSEFTVLRALSLAEGLDRTAAPKKAKILRKQVNGGRIEIPVDLSRILDGRAPDSQLRAEDVLFVPNNTAKNAGLKTLDMVMQTATGMAIYGRY